MSTIRDRATWHKAKQGKNKIELAMIEELLPLLDPENGDDYPILAIQRRRVNAAVNHVCRALDMLADLVEGGPPDA